MSDYLLLDGDSAMFMPSFGAAMVAVQPGTLRATGPATLNGKKLCVAGDEASVSVKGCTYVTPSYPIPGTGMLEIASLGGDQTAKKPFTGSTATLLVGSSFKARFVVQSPAQQPTASGPVPDATPQYYGSGSFITTNTKLRGV